MQNIAITINGDEGEEGELDDGNMYVHSGLSSETRRDRRERQSLLSQPTFGSPPKFQHGIPTSPTQPNAGSQTTLAFRKRKGGGTRNIKFSHLFSVLLDVVVLACVVYVCIRTNRYWFTFSAPVAPTQNGTIITETYPPHQPIPSTPSTPSSSLFDSSDNPSNHSFILNNTCIYDVGTLRICCGLTGVCTSISFTTLYDGLIVVDFVTLGNVGMAALALCVLGAILIIVKLPLIFARVHRIFGAQKSMVLTDVAILLTIFSTLSIASAALIFNFTLNAVFAEAYIIAPSETGIKHDTITIHHEPDYAFVLAIVSAVGEFTVAICLFIGRFIERDFGSQMYWKNTSFWKTWRKKYNKKTTLTVNYEDVEGDFHNWETFVKKLEQAKRQHHAFATATPSVAATPTAMMGGVSKENSFVGGQALAGAHRSYYYPPPPPSPRQGVAADQVPLLQDTRYG